MMLPSVFRKTTFNHINMPLPSGFFSDYVYRVLSPKSVKSIEDCLDRYPVYLMAVRISNLSEIIDNNNIYHGIELLKQMAPTITRYFHACFPNGEIFVIEPTHFDEILIGFHSTGRPILSLKDQATDLSRKVRRSLQQHHNGLSESQQRVAIDHGYATIRSAKTEDNFYEILFKALCQVKNTLYHGDIARSEPEQGLAKAAQTPVAIVELVKEPLCVSPDTLISDLKEQLKTMPPLCSIVVLDQQKIMGLIMSHHLDRLLGTRYGVSLYYHRPVSALMDPMPLIVEASEPLGKVAQAAMKRDDDKRYDDIIVVENDLFMGTVSVQDMLTGLVEAELEARKMAEMATKAKSQFLVNMSHDIRTPMTAILGMAELLWDSPLTETQKKYVSIFRDAGETLLELINDILDLSKVEAGKIQLERIPFSIRDILRKTCATLEIKAHEKGLNLKWDVSDHVPTCLMGDPSRLQRVLFNLIGNAIKFTHYGEIIVSVSADNRSSVDLDDTTGCLRFCIRDTGIGISKEKQSDIFDAFVQADNDICREYGGTGVGLAICKKLVQLMEGEIGVESEPGIGSTFWFTAAFDVADKPIADRFSQQPQWIISDPGNNFPKSHPSATNHMPKPSSPHSSPNMNYPPLKILLAEDNQNNRMLFEFFLEGTPFEVDFAENGQICVEKFLTHKYDLIFMDIEMPVMDGYAATRAIRTHEQTHRTSPIPIIALTAHALKGKEDESIAAGCTTHMIKPFKKTDLFQTIEKYIPTDCLSPSVWVDAQIEPLIPEFIKLTREEVQILQTEFAKQDREAVRRYAHKIKGAALCYGFDELAEMTKHIEIEVQKPNRSIASLRPDIEKLGHYIENVQVRYK